MKNDIECSQSKVIQGDVLSDRRQAVCFGVELDFGKLLAECQQVAKQFGLVDFKLRDTLADLQLCIRVLSNPQKLSAAV